MGLPNPVRTLSRQIPIAYGWFVVACCFGLSVMTFGTIYSYTVFFQSLQATFGGSHASLSLLFGVQTFVAFISAGLFGVAIDRYGPQSMLAVAGALVTLGFLTVSRLESFGGILVFYGGVLAVGLGIVYVVAYTTPAKYFHGRTTTPTAVAVSGTGIGILLVPPAAEQSINWIGWRRSYLLLVSVFLVVIALSILTLRAEPQPHDTQPRQPPSPEEGAVSLGTLVQTPLFALVFVAFFCAFVPTYAVSVYFVEFAQSVDISRNVGVLSVSVFGASSVGIKLTTGPISDRAGIVPTMAGFVTVMCVATVTLVAQQTVAGLLVAAGLLGVGYGGVDALLAPLIVSVFGTDNLSSTFGAVAVAFALAGSIVPYAVGAGFDRIGSFELPFLFAALAGSGAIAALAVLHRIRS